MTAESMPCLGGSSYIVFVLSRSVPFWAIAIAVLFLIFFCICFNLHHLQRLYGYKDIPDDDRGRTPEVGADATWGSGFWGGKDRKQKVDEEQPDGDVPATPLNAMGGWLPAIPSVGQGPNGWNPFGGTGSQDALRDTNATRA